MAVIPAVLIDTLPGVRSKSSYLLRGCLLTQWATSNIEKTTLAVAFPAHPEAC